MLFWACLHGKASTPNCYTTSARFSCCYFAVYGSFATSSPFKLTPSAPSHPKLYAHRLQVRCYEVSDITQVFQVVAFATRYMGNMAAPDAPPSSCCPFFDPDLHNKRLGLELDLIHSALVFQFI